VIESLRGTMLLAQEVKPLLEILIPGLKIDELTVTVTSIQQASPLKELFAVGLVGAYQDKIGADMPQIVHDLFGVTPPPKFDNLISLLLIVLVFYSGLFAFNTAEKLAQKLKTHRQLDGLIADVAKMLERDEASIREALDKKYQKSGISNVLLASLKFLTPSKNQNNAALTVNSRHFPQDVIAEFPNPAQLKMEEPGPTSYPLENVDLHIHAQDVDRNKQGWAAVVPTVSSKRIPMSLMPPLSPSDVYMKDAIKGDILVESRKNSEGETVPVRVHLIRFSEQTTNPPAASLQAATPPAPPKGT
jgi:hypothetical protein